MVVCFLGFMGCGWFSRVEVLWFVFLRLEVVLCFPSCLGIGGCGLFLLGFRCCGLCFRFLGCGFFSRVYRGCALISNNGNRSLRLSDIN